MYFVHNLKFFCLSILMLRAECFIDLLHAIAASILNLQREIFVQKDLILGGIFRVVYVTLWAGLMGYCLETTCTFSTISGLCLNWKFD